MFFTQIEPFPATVNSLISSIVIKRKRREGRIRETADTLPSVAVSSVRSIEYLKNNILSFIKHKKSIGPYQPEQLIYCNMTDQNSSINTSYLPNGSDKTAKPINKSASKNRAYLNKSYTRRTNSVNQTSNINNNNNSMNYTNKTILPPELQASILNYSKLLPSLDFKQNMKSKNQNQTYDSYSAQKPRRVLLVENPLAKSNRSHQNNNRSSRSLVQNDLSSTNRRNDSFHEDIENFFNYSVRVKKVIHTNGQSHEASFNEEGLTNRSKSQIIAQNSPNARVNTSEVAKQRHSKTAKNENRLRQIVKPTSSVNSSTVQTRMDSRSMRLSYLFDDNHKTSMGVLSKNKHNNKGGNKDDKSEKDEIDFTNENLMTRKDSVDEKHTKSFLMKSIEVHRSLLARKKRPEDFADSLNSSRESLHSAIRSKREDTRFLYKNGYVEKQKKSNLMTFLKTKIKMDLDKTPSNLVKNTSNRSSIRRSNNILTTGRAMSVFPIG